MVTVGGSSNWVFMCFTERSPQTRSNEYLLPSEALARLPSHREQKYLEGSSENKDLQKGTISREYGNAMSKAGPLVPHGKAKLPTTVR